MDFKHPTNQFLLFVIFFLLLPALSIMLSLWLSGDIYYLNCELNCHEKLKVDLYQ